MAGLRTTPSLETVPTEIMYLIGSHLHDDEFGSITQASRTLRHVFLPRRYARIKFSGTVKQVAERLTTMFAMSCDAISMNMRHLIETSTRFVTFRIHYSRHDARVPLQFPQSDLEHFPILLHSINRLCGVNYSLETPTHRDVLVFNKALRKTGSWSTNGDKPFSLTFLDKPDVSNFNAVVRRFKPGTLGAVQLPQGFNRQYYVILKKSPHSQALKALHIDRTVKRQSSQPVIPSLEHEIIGEIRNDFPQLESLILHEDTPYLCDSGMWPFEFELTWSKWAWFDDQLTFDGAVNALATSLNSVPRLRRFAFTLWFVRLHRRLVSPGDRPRTMLELDNFYINNFVTPIMTQVPTLVELCVSSEHPIFYRGIRQDDRIHVQRESRDNPGEEKRFPSLLLDLN